MLSLLLSGAAASAQSVWNIGTGNWNSAASWLPAVVPVSDPSLHLIFNATTAYTSTNNIGPMVLNRLTVNNTSNGTLTLAASATANTLTFDGVNPTLDITGTVRFTGLMGGSATITKTGTGTFIHDSDNAAFTGTIIIDGGRFSNWCSNTTGVTNFNPVAIIVNNGGTYQFGNAGTGDPNLPTSTYITVNAGGAVSWQETQTFGGFNLLGGSIELTGGNATANGTAAQTWTHGTLSGNALPAGGLSVGGSSLINKTTAGTLTLTGAVSINSSGGLRIQEGTVVMSEAINLGTANLTFGDTGKTGTLEYRGASATRAGNLVRATGGAGVINVTQPSTILTLSGANSGSGTLTKTGPGTLHLTGALGATSTTRVSEGMLRVNPAVASGAFMVETGAVLAVNAGTGGTSLSVPTLVLGGSGASTLQLELNTNVTTSQPLVTVRNPSGFVFSEAATLRVTNAQAFANGLYTLVDYDGIAIEQGINLLLPGRTLGNLVYDTDNTQILMDITGTDTVKWTGAVNSTWDIGTEANVGGTQNWKLATGGTSTNFIDTDTVTFDDTAVNRNVQLSDTMKPAVVTVNTATEYSFTGEGKISGSTGLTKTGTGTLILATDNDYSGGTIVSAGTFQLGNGGTRGSFTGALSLSSSTLAFNRADDFTFDNTVNLLGSNVIRQNGTGTLTINSALVLGTNALTVEGSGTLNFAGTVSGSGVWNFNGPGRVNLTGNHSFTGTLNINGGVVQLTDFDANTLVGDLDAASIIVNSGATFIFGPGSNPDLPGTTIVTVNAGGLYDLRTGESYGGIVLNGGEYRTSGSNTGASSTGTAATPGAAVYDFRSGSVSTAFTGAGAGGLLNQSGGGVLAKTTSGTVTMGSGVTLGASMPVQIREGTLAMQPGTVPTTGTATNGTGSALATFDFGTATTQGTLQVQGLGTATSSRAVTVAAGGGRVDVVEAGTALTLTGAISGTGPLTKSGAGTLNLSGALGSTGMTIVEAGTLRVKPGTAAAGLSVASGAILAVNSDAVVASLNAPLLTLSGGSTLQLELNTGIIPSAPLINVTGSNGLSFSGAGNVLLQVSNTQAFQSGVYTLLDYSGSAISSGFTLKMEGRATGTLVYDTANTKINASITPGEEVRWKGTVSSNWDVGTGVNIGGTQNWTTVTSLAATNFVQTDYVRFDDSASQFNVNLNTEVRPNGIIVNAAADYTFGGSGKITGTTTLNKSGTGTLLLTTNNDFSGLTTISGGKLQLGNGGTAGSLGAGSISVGGTLAFNRSDAVAMANAITVTASSTLAQNGSGTVSLSSAWALGASSLTVTGTGNLTLSGVISGTAAQPVVMNGTGTLFLPATNTFTGTTIINSGIVSVSSTGGLGAAAADVTINGGTLQITAGGIGSVNNTTGRSVTVGAAGAVFDFRVAQTFNGNGFLGTGNVTKTGGGRWTVGSNGSTFSGEILIAEGSLLMTSAQLQSAKNITVADGAQFIIDDDAAGSWRLATGGKFTFNGDGGGTGALRQFNSGAVPAAGTFTSTFVPEVVLNSASTVINAEADYGIILLTGNVTGIGGLTKTGPGTLTLTGAANSYAGGTLINGGTLLVNNTTGSGTGSGAVVIANGGRLMGTGTIAGATAIQSGGILQSGMVTTRGTLTFSDALTLSSGSRGDFHLSANGSNDKVIAGTLTLDPNAVIRIILGYTPAAGDTFDLIDWAAVGAGSDSNWADNLDLSNALLGGTLGWDTSRFNSQGILSVVVAVPEPSRLVLMAGGLTVLLLRRRRKA